MSGILMSIITTRPIEDMVGYLLSGRKGHDAGLFTRNAAISSAASSVSITSPDCGDSGCTLATAYASHEIGGQSRIPSLRWTAPAETSPKVKEWLMVSEDPDAPMAEPIVHGLYYGIPASKTSIEERDYEVADGATKRLKGGFWYGANRRGIVYMPPRPPARHGVHRYFFSVVGLGQNVDWEAVGTDAGENGVGKTELLKAIEGKVVCWGEWIGNYERK